MSEIRLLLSLAIIAGVSMLSACAPPTEMAATAPTAKKPLPKAASIDSIALLVPYEPTDPQWEVLATNLENGARMAIDHVGMQQEQLRVYATGGNAQQAEEAASAAIADGADVILGPAFSHTTRAVAPIAAARRIPVYSFSNDQTVAGGNVTVLGLTATDRATRLVGFSSVRGFRRAIIVGEDTRSGNSAVDALIRAADRYPHEVLDVIVHEFSQNGVIDAVERTLESAETHQPDIIYFTGTSAGSLPLLTRLLNDRGLGPNELQYAGVSRWDIPQTALRFQAFQGAWFPLPDPSLVNRFGETYEARYGTAPHPLASLGYDGVVVLQAMATDRQFAAMRVREDGATVEGATGHVRLLPDGTTRRGLVIGSIGNQQLYIIRDSPLELAVVTMVDYLELPETDQ